MRDYLSYLHILLILITIVVNKDLFVCLFTRSMLGYPIAQCSDNEELDLLYIYMRVCVCVLIIKITISSIGIGLKNSYFPLIHLPSCYRTVQQTNHIQSCSLNQPITTLVSSTIETVYKLLNCQFFNVNFPVVT